MNAPSGSSRVHVARGSPTSTPHTKTISPLLKLPSELRNHIYQLVLSSERILQFESWETSPAYITEVVAAAKSDAPRVHKDHPPPHFVECGRGIRLAGGFNQLKYSCHQLYNETAGLEVKFNCVTFFDCSDSYATPAFLRFINECSPKKVEWFTDINLEVVPERTVDLDMLVEPLASLLPIAEFCRKHPKIKVRYLPDHFHTSFESASTFFMIGSYLNKVYRGKDQHTALRRMVSGGYNPFYSPTWRVDAVGIAALNVPNFRFWPIGYPSFDEEEFRKALINDTRFDLDHQIYVDIAKKWYENGI
jgi:hypothetical protein